MRHSSCSRPIMDTLYTHILYVYSLSLSVAALCEGNSDPGPGKTFDEMRKEIIQEGAG